MLFFKQTWIILIQSTKQAYLGQEALYHLKVLMIWSPSNNMIWLTLFLKKIQENLIFIPCLFSFTKYEKHYQRQCPKRRTQQQKHANMNMIKIFYNSSGSLVEYVLATIIINYSVRIVTVHSYLKDDNNFWQSWH